MTGEAGYVFASSGSMLMIYMKYLAYSILQKPYEKFE